MQRNSLEAVRVDICKWRRDAVQKSNSFLFYGNWKFTFYFSFAVLVWSAFFGIIVIKLRRVNASNGLMFLTALFSFALLKCDASVRSARITLRMDILARVASKRSLRTETASSLLARFWNNGHRILIQIFQSRSKKRREFDGFTGFLLCSIVHRHAGNGACRL